jgi:nucleoside diphosphate kinase
MAEELGYVIINPYTIYKSRTGGVLARLLTRTALDLVGAQMFAPSPELVAEYAKDIVQDNDPQDRFVQELIKKYIEENFAPDPSTGLRRRVMVLLFKGEDAVARVRAAVGHFHKGGDVMKGETIRETYGDFILNRDGSVRYFEPAVLAPPTVAEARHNLKIWAKYAEKDGGLLENVLPGAKDANHQRTLVIIKPDNFKFPSGRPGNVIDIFSQTGLAVTAIKVHRMSVAEAEEFYGPVQDVLRKKMAEQTASRSKELLQSALGFEIPADVQKKMGDLLGPLAGDQQFHSIIKFMTGRTPLECTGKQREEPGTEKSIILVYEGVNAVAKIREVLGPTDPAKAPPGSIRREFGQTIMVNAAHASDSAENAQREMKIVKIRDNNFRRLVDEFYK